MKGYTYSKRTKSRPATELAAIEQATRSSAGAWIASRKSLRAARNEARNSGIRGDVIFGLRMGGKAGITTHPRGFRAAP